MTDKYNVRLGETSEEYIERLMPEFISTSVTSFVEVDMECCIPRLAGYFVLLVNAKEIEVDKLTEHAHIGISQMFSSMSSPIQCAIFTRVLQRIMSRVRESSAKKRDEDMGITR